MAHYSGRLIIHNETELDLNKPRTEQGLIATLRFSASFNKQKLYLNNTILKQVLSSGAVQEFITEETINTFRDNEKIVNEKIKKLFAMENKVTIQIKIIGLFFYVKFYCGRNHNVNDLIEALIRKFKNEKTQIEILRG